MHLKPHDYRIYYVNIDSRHQYGISVAELQTFLLTKRPSAAMSEEKINVCHSQAKPTGVTIPSMHADYFFNYSVLLWAVCPAQKKNIVQVSSTIYNDYNFLMMITFLFHSVIC